MKITYYSNNSGGYWWLTDENWYALENAGWVVDWRKSRWLGALATKAYREGLTIGQAVNEWETVTNESAYNEGCECCGLPHDFHEEI